MNIEDTDSEDDLRSEDDEDDYDLSDDDMEAPDNDGDIIDWEELCNVVSGMSNDKLTIYSRSTNCFSSFAPP